MMYGGGERSLMGQASDFAGKYGAQASKIGKGLSLAQKSGLLGGQQPAPVALPTPPGGGAQAPGMPTSTQISEQSFAPQNPQPLSYEEMLRRRLMMG
jgi:hypothetical protein